MQNNTKKAITKFTKQNNPTTKWNSNKTNVNEIKHAIFQMDNEKSPEEFYEYLKDDLYQLFINILLTEKRSLKTMNQAIIILIPKN